MANTTAVEPQSGALHGRLALVTGASGMIGAAVARRLTRDGASVIVHYNSDKAGAMAVVGAITDAGGEAVAIAADLGASAGPAFLIEQLDASFDGRFAHRLDVLVNNAGTLDLCPLTETSDEAFDRLMSVNVRAPFVLAREAARRMIPNGWGRIIVMGSVFGEAAPLPGLATYCGTKFAVRGLARGWSRDLGAAGITVNTIQPAVIAASPVPTGGPVFDAMKRFTSVGRFGAPEEIANAVSFLASPSASFINGSSATIDGGWSA